MAKAFKVKFTKSIGSLPNGYEIQVISDQSSKPTENEIRKALEAAGFKGFTGGTVLSISGSYTVS
jgi:hypothetical protein